METEKDGRDGAANPTTTPPTETLGTASLAEVRARIQPLDLLLFKGVDAVSRAIRFVEAEALGDDEFSHAGLVVTAECLPSVDGMQADRPYVWESTSSLTFGGLVSRDDPQPPDVETGRGRMGAQIRDLDALVPAYLSAGEGAAVAWCPLRDNPWRARDGEDESALAARRADLVREIAEVHRRLGRSPYDWNPLDLLAAAVPSARPAREFVKELAVEGERVLTTLHLRGSAADAGPAAPEWVFCSELVAAVYVRTGVLPPRTDPEDIAPVEFLGHGDLPCIVERVVRLHA